MRRYLKKCIVSFFIALPLPPCLVYANMWPVFGAPNKAFLLDHQQIEMSQCPPGQGRLKPQSMINIHQECCKTYCPDSWTWISISDNKCHRLTNNFGLQSYAIEHHTGEDGSTLYSSVTAYYGDKNSDGHTFKLVFTTPKEHWYCYENNPELHLIICANDI